MRCAGVLLAIAVFLFSAADAGAADSRLRLGVDLSYTSIEYFESPGSISSVQDAVRAGVSLDVRLKWWVWLSLAGSVTSLGSFLSPSYSGPATASGSDPTPSFWDGAIRAPFSLLNRSSRWDLRITPAVSGWGMWVPEQAFGVRYLIEPQFQVELRRKVNGSRKWGLRATGAIHGFSGSFLEDNRLLKVAADFQLNSGRAKQAWSLTAGFRDNAYVNDLLSMSSKQWMVGLAIQW